MHDVVLFLFAHQDDEFGVFGEICRLRSHGHRVVVAYLTSGGLDGRQRPDRDNESVTVLLKLGVARNDVHFVGTGASIRDGRLSESIERAYRGLLDLVQSIGEPKYLYYPAWEGGHQDHDSVHLVGLALARHLNRLDDSFQFPLYTGDRLPWLFFRLFSPLNANGNVISFIIPFPSRVRFTRCALSYPSQGSTWVGLFPFLLFHYMFLGTQILQRVSVRRILTRPHAGKLLYERRNVCTYAKFSADVVPFIESYLPSEP